MTAGIAPPIMLLPPQSVRDLLLFNFGTEVRIYPKESNPTIGTTPVLLGLYTNVRVALTVSNPSSNTIYLGYSTAVSTTNGLVLAANSSIAWTWYLDGEIVIQPLYAIAAGAGNKLYVVESSLIGA
jgi:hypothetical protein